MRSLRAGAWQIGAGGVIRDQAPPINEVRANFRLVGFLGPDAHDAEIRSDPVDSIFDIDSRWQRMRL